MICIFNNKKFVSELISALIVLILCSQVFAYEKSMEYDFNSGSNGNAYLDGSSNGKFYSFKPGNVQLDFTNQKGTGTLSISLRRQYGYVLYKSYGTKNFNVKPNYSSSTKWSVDTNSDKYYLYLQGTGTYVQYVGYGTMHQD